MEKDKIKFRDLSGWLKALVVIAWIYIIATFFKDNPYFTEDILSLIPILVRQIIVILLFIWFVVWGVKTLIRVTKQKKK